MRYVIWHPNGGKQEVSKEQYVGYLRECAARWRGQPGDKAANARQAKRVEKRAEALAR